MNACCHAGCIEIYPICIFVFSFYFPSQIQETNTHVLFLPQFFIFSMVFLLDHRTWTLHCILDNPINQQDARAQRRSGTLEATKDLHLYDIVQVNYILHPSSLVFYFVLFFTKCSFWLKVKWVKVCTVNYCFVLSKS